MKTPFINKSKIKAMEKLIFTKDRSGTYKRFRVYTSGSKYIIRDKDSEIARVESYDDALALIRSVSGGEITEIKDN